MLDLKLFLTYKHNILTISLNQLCYLLFSPTSCIGTKTKSATPYDVPSNAGKSSVQQL